MSSDVSVGHGLGHALHHGGSNKGSWGSLDHGGGDWGSHGGSVGKVVVEVIVSEGVSVGVVTSSVGSIGTVSQSVISQAVVSQAVPVVESISISLRIIIDEYFYVITASCITSASGLASAVGSASLLAILVEVT